MDRMQDGNARLTAVTFTCACVAPVGRCAGGGGQLHHGAAAGTRHGFAASAVSTPPGVNGHPLGSSPATTVQLSGHWKLEGVLVISDTVAACSMQVISAADSVEACELSATALAVPASMTGTEVSGVGCESLAVRSSSKVLLTPSSV
jgi:hypothetical protein